MSIGRVVVAWALARRAGEWLALAVTPLVVNLGVLVLGVRSRGGAAYGCGWLAAVWPGGHFCVAGRTAFVYPPVAAYVFVPFTWMPTPVATVSVSLLMLACAPAVLWMLGVRDWRCYGASLLWAPVVSSVRLGALSLPLALLVAVARRYRERAAIAATALGTAIALKLFLPPLLLWPVARKRRSYPGPRRGRRSRSRSHSPQRPSLRALPAPRGGVQWMRT